MPSHTRFVAPEPFERISLAGTADWVSMAAMTRVLAVADEVDPSLYSRNVRRHEVELILACGDLPFDYLEFLVSMLNVPLGFVPGNHDPDLHPPDAIDSADFTKPFAWHWADRAHKGPQGCVNLDGWVKELSGVRVAGLGGSIRYSPGPNQYSETQMRSRAWRLRMRDLRRRLTDRHPVDILITHAPPRGVGDGDDRAHRGFQSFHTLIAKMGPRLLLHGHVHPYGERMPEREVGRTRVINVVGHKVIEL